MALADLDPADEGDVDDPAGGDEATYTACAAQVSALVAELVPRLG
jgi:protein-tyrosine-phosphatase